MGHDQTPSVLSNTGFGELAPVAAAWAWLDSLPAPAAAETLPLEAAWGRLLANDVSLDPPAPHPPRTATNGYAVHAAACAGASPYNPLLLALLPPGTGVLPDATTRQRRYPTLHHICIRWPR